MRDVFELERTTNIPATSYILSYPHILSYFADRAALSMSPTSSEAHTLSMDGCQPLSIFILSHPI
jgi:hypothetical protein